MRPIFIKRIKKNTEQIEKWNIGIKYKTERKREEHRRKEFQMLTKAKEEKKYIKKNIDQIRFGKKNNQYTKNTKEKPNTVNKIKIKDKKKMYIYIQEAKYGKQNQGKKEKQKCREKKNKESRWKELKEKIQRRQ